MAPRVLPAIFKHIGGSSLLQLALHVVETRQHQHVSRLQALIAPFDGGDGIARQRLLQRMSQGIMKDNQLRVEIAGDGVLGSHGMASGRMLLQGVEKTLHIFAGGKTIDQRLLHGHTRWRFHSLSSLSPAHVDADGKANQQAHPDP